MGPPPPGSFRTGSLRMGSSPDGVWSRMVYFRDRTCEEAPLVTPAAVRSGTRGGPCGGSGTSGRRPSCSPCTRAPSSGKARRSRDGARECRRRRPRIPRRLPPRRRRGRSFDGCGRARTPGRAPPSRASTGHGQSVRAGGPSAPGRAPTRRAARARPCPGGREPRGPRRPDGPMPASRGRRGRGGRLRRTGSACADSAPRPGPGRRSVVEDLPAPTEKETAGPPRPPPCASRFGEGFLQRLAVGGEGLQEVLLRVGRRDEHRLEGGRRDEDAPLQEPVEPAVERRPVALLHVVEVGDRSRVEEEGQDRADPIEGEPVGDAELLGDLPHPLLELRRGLLELRVGRGRQRVEHGDAGGHGERVPRERSRLVDGAVGGDVGHQVGPAAVGPDREPAAEDLPEARQVGPDLEELLRAPLRQAEAGDHLVEEEERALPVGDLPEPLEEARLREDDAHVRGDRLDGDDGDPPRVLPEEPLDGVEVVVLRRERRLRELGRDARRAGDPERREAGAGRDEERVGVAVVAAGELQDEVAPRRGAREAHRAHRRLGPRGDEADLLHGRDEAGDALGELHLGAARRAVRRPAREGSTDRGGDRLRHVAEEVRAVRHDVVDVAVPVSVDDHGALRLLHEERRRADRLERADGRADAARHLRLRARVEAVGLDRPADAAAAGGDGLLRGLLLRGGRRGRLPPHFPCSHSAASFA